MFKREKVKMKEKKRKLESRTQRGIETEKKDGKRESEQIKNERKK